MRKLLLPLIFLASGILIAQETPTTTLTQNTDGEYNRWSIEVSGGVHKTSRPFAPGYFTNTPAFGQGQLGVRYMFNDKFGMRLGLGYSALKNRDESLPFKTNSYRGALEGVVNLTRLLNFSDWSNNVGLLAHGGAGYSMMDHKSPIDMDGM